MNRRNSTSEGFTARPRRTPGGPQGNDRSNLMAELDALTRRINRIRFRDLDRGRVFVRVPDLRRRLMWPREVFDGLLRVLRDEEALQLHAGDVTLMTPDEVEDCFVDEFGARKRTVTLKK